MAANMTIKNRLKVKPVRLLLSVFLVTVLLGADFLDFIEINI